MNANEFEARARAVLERLMDRIEAAAGDVWDVDLEDGVLTVELPGGGQYLLNRHAPTGELWLSSPASGAAHFALGRGERPLARYARRRRSRGAAGKRVVARARPPARDRRRRMNVAQARASDRAPSRELRHLKRLLRYLAPYRWAIAGALLALTVSAAAVLSLGVGLRALIDGGFAAGDPGLFDRALAGLIAAVAVLSASAWGRFYLVSWLGERVIADMRRDVYDHAIGLSPRFLETVRTGEVVSRLTTDTTLLQAVVGATASSALRNLLLLVGAAAMLIVTSPALTALVAALVPAVVAPIVVFGRRVRRLSRAAQDRVADAAARAEESLNAVRTVQAFTHEPLDRSAFGARVEAAFGAAIARVRARAWLTALAMTAVFSAVAAVFWAGGRAVLAGDMSGGALAQFVFFAVVAAGAVGAISEVYGDLQRAGGAAERLLDLLDVAPDVAAIRVLAHGAATLEVPVKLLGTSLHLLHRELPVLRQRNERRFRHDAPYVSGPHRCAQETHLFH